MIRGGIGSDSAAMGRIYCEAWKKAYAGIVQEDFLDSLTPETAAPPAGRITPENCVVCELDGEVVGLACFGQARDGSAGKGEIYSIYVLPGYWKQGTGRSLFEAVCDKLAEAGYSKLCLWTLSENSRARAFYERMGMRKTGERTTEIAGKPLPETGYEKYI